MWLCTQLGFYGIVHKEPDTYLIRARCREDLDLLAQAAGTGTPIASYSGSDYPWRILCPAADLPKFMSALSESIAYGKLTRSHLMFVSPFGQRAAVCLRLSALRSGCLGSRHSPRLTDIAARPPENVHFQKDRDTIEKRSGRWLKELSRQSQTTGLNLNRWIPAWEKGSSGRQIPGKN